MGFYGDFIWFYDDVMGFYWWFNGIYPQVNMQETMENHHL